MIDDEELRDLFAAEAAEILARMEQGLLDLERSPEERSLIESVFRQAHSLKGSAASLGLSAVESVAHHFEDALDAARHGRQPLTPARADRLYGTLDVLRQLVEEAVTGKACGVDIRDVFDRLNAPLEERAAAVPASSASARTGPPLAETRSAPDVEKPPAATLATPVPVVEVPPVAGKASPEPAVPVATGKAASSGSIRVETVRLDRALAEMGDLVVTAARIGLRRSEAQELRDLHEAWVREWRLRGHHHGATGNGDPLLGFGARLDLFIRALSDDQTRLEQITDHLREEIQEMRLLPLAGLLDRYPRVVRDLARQEGKEIRFEVEGGETTADRRLLERLSAPLTHLVRNAVDHGAERPAQRLAKGKPAEVSLKLAAVRKGPILEVSLRDDGAGIDLKAIRERALELRLRTAEALAQASDSDLAALIFVPGFSTRTVVSDLSGRGTGLDAVRADVEAMNGTVTVESVPGRGTSFFLRIPLTLATSQVMVCSCVGRLFAIPLAYVERSLLFDNERTFPIEGRPCLEVDGNLVPISRLDRVLGENEDAFEGSICLIVRDQTERHGFVTQGLLGVMEIVVKPFYESRLVGGASILPDGRVCLLLQSQELLRLARSRVADAATEPPDAAPRKASLLLAEDSPTIRLQACKALELAGYQVTAVEDGALAWKLALSQTFDAVISDIEMPHLDGLELTRKLRTLEAYRDIPILLVTSLEADESRLAGLEAGASVYLAKSSLKEGSLLRVLERLL